LVLAAEKRSGQRPKRRTELLQKRIEAFVKSREPAEKRLSSQQVALAAAEQAKVEILAQLRTVQEKPETKPKHLQTLERRCLRRDQAMEVARKKLSKTQAWLNAHLEQEKVLRNDWNSSNARTPKICSRLKPVSVSTLASVPTTTSPC
jgi:hypothetical protein